MRKFVRRTLVLGAAVVASAALLDTAIASAGKARVSEVRLYTQPASPACGEKVRLVTEIHTTEPGTVDFTLMRRVGRNQNASLTTGKDGDGYVQRWYKEYVYKHSVTREYRVVIKGHEIATDWVAVDVACAD